MATMHLQLMKTTAIQQKMVLTTGGPGSLLTLSNTESKVDSNKKKSRFKTRYHHRPINSPPSNRVQGECSVGNWAKTKESQKIAVSQSLGCLVVVRTAQRRNVKTRSRN